MGVLIPLDKICVKSGVLCPSCEARIESGEYDEWEVDVMRVMVEVEHRLQGQVKYVKSHMADGEIYVFVEHSGALPAWLGQELSRRLGKRVYIVEYSRDLRLLASSLIAPSKVLGLDYSYLPDGSTILKIKVDRRPRRGVEELARRVLGMVSGMEVHIEEEQIQSNLDVRPDKRDVRSILDRLDL